MPQSPLGDVGPVSPPSDWLCVPPEPPGRRSLGHAGPARETQAVTPRPVGRQPPGRVASPPSRSPSFGPSPRGHGGDRVRCGSRSQRLEPTLPFYPRSALPVDTPRAAQAASPGSDSPTGLLPGMRSAERGLPAPTRRSECGRGNRAPWAEGVSEVMAVRGRGSSVRPSGANHDKPGAEGR